MNLLIVDDHPLLRAGIKVILSKNSLYNIEEAGGGEEAISLIKVNPYNFVILDIDMPGINGVELAVFIKNNYPSIKIIFLTSHTDIYTFSEAIETSFSGFLFKENAIDQINDCLKIVSRGEKYLSKSCTDFLFANKEKLTSIKKIKKAFKQLTDAEINVLRLISEGKTTPQIADCLFNSPKTIENHRTNICQKLELKGSNNLLTFALENKWVFKNDKN